MPEGKQHDEHCNDHGDAKTAEMARDLVGTAAMRSAESIAEDEGFRFNADIFDTIVFSCCRCDWWCSMDENNESKHGEWICDDCKAEEDDD